MKHRLSLPRPDRNGAAHRHGGVAKVLTGDTSFEERVRGAARSGGR